jgi:threonine dehydratase
VAANRLVELPAITSIARTLGAPRASAFTLRGVQQLVDRLMVVEDAATVTELILLLERTKQLVEPAAACCLAAAREDCSHWQPTDNVVILLCGGNASLQDVAKWSGLAQT